MPLTQADIEYRLQTYIDPYTGKDWISQGVLSQCDIQADAINLTLTFGYPLQRAQAALTRYLQDLLQPLLAGRRLNLHWQTEIQAHAVQQGLKGISNVKNIIAVASGKGGVGKSTTTANLALALQQDGARVGVLDADICGPSQPQMLGSQQRPESPDERSFIPVMAHGLQTISIGYLIDQDSPVIWRGPMVTGALQQLLNETRWDDLDYLLIDLPPGTGDIQLTLAQKIPVSGAIIVTTPQDISLLDARRGLKMFEKVNVPVLGVVENMSLHTCSQCGHQEPIFGQGGGESLAEQEQVPLLGQLPLLRSIREQADSGLPTVIAEPDSDVAESYRDIARKATGLLSLRSRNYARQFPNIVIETTE